MNSDDAYTALEEEILAFINTPDGGADSFNDLSLRVHAFQRSRNPVYDVYCASLDSSLPPKSWHTIPPVPQSVFKDHALRCYPAEQDVVTFRTSGTSGEGFGCHHFVSLRLYDDAALAGWRGLNIPARPFHILAQSDTDAPFSSLSHMMALFADHAPAHRFYVDASGRLDTDGLLRELGSEDEPVVVAGTALAFLHLFENMNATGTRMALPPGSVAMETGGYKGSGRSLSKKDLYAMFLSHLGLAAEDVINEYGMTELSSQFYTRGLDAPHRSGPWLRALVIDPETQQPCAAGRIGTLRIFDLANLGSCLAVQTRDLAIATEDEGEFHLIGRDADALPRGCSRSADELLGG